MTDLKVGDLVVVKPMDRFPGGSRTPLTTGRVYCLLTDVAYPIEVMWDDLGGGTDVYKQEELIKVCLS